MNTFAHKKIIELKAEYESLLKQVKKIDNVNALNMFCLYKK